MPIEGLEAAATTSGNAPVWATILVVGFMLAYSVYYFTKRK